ncbi:MAG: TlyA family RNA methyltransferase [Acidimicrobiales bacterium]|nr:TlyA family RNA methyltransferase [Hyphomonadaceae bacterium]RZV40851.1 MAG: TlyA family RNA methyltransferase [Acidimicrobiales bacterium]
MRADKFLAQNGYYESRAKAHEAIDAGLVIIDDQIVRKPSQMVGKGAIIRADKPYPWVSRAGVKLDHALTCFGVDVKGEICIDVGSSTGGFTQVLCANGAQRVYAVDVGRDQLRATVKADPRVVSLEQCDARSLSSEQFEEPPNLIVCDVSFISCMKALDRPLALAAEMARLITLVKPQFEVGKDNVGKGGIVRDQSLALQSVETVKSWLIEQGWRIKGQDISPIKGGDGNTEYLVYAVRG